MQDKISQFKVFMDSRAGAAVEEVLRSGYIGQGPKVEEFEEELKKYLEFDYGVTVNSATSALWLALHLIGVGPGDWVVSTPMTCSATNEVITLMGAHILWADVDGYGNISPSGIWYALHDQELKGLPKPKAIMAVDWGGLPCDYERIREHSLPIVEDAAHAYGARYKGYPIAKTGGDFIAYSFQAIKHLTTGDGGLLVVPDKEYERAKLLRWYGLDRTTGQDAMRCRQDIVEAGYKFHMNDISATIGLANMDGSRWVVKKHQENAKYYDEVFERHNLLPPWPRDRVSSNWVYTIHVDNPEKFEKWMATQGVSVSQVHNRNDNYTCFKYYRRSLPNLDKFFSTMVCIPVGWWISKTEREYIANKVIEYVH